MGFVPDSGALQNTAASALFAKAFLRKAPKSTYPAFTMVNDTHFVNTPYPILGRVQRMKRGRPKFEGLKEFDFSVTIGEPHETGVPVNRTAYERDQTGILKRIMPQVGIQAASAPQRSAFKALADGALTSGDGFQNGYDGFPLYSATHTLNDGTTNQTNIKDWFGLGNGITIATDDFKTRIVKFLAQFDFAFEQIAGFVDSHGEPWFEDLLPEDMIVTCSPTLYWTIVSALKAELVDATTNVLGRKNQVKQVIMSPHLKKDSQDNDVSMWWQLHVVGSPSMMPLLHMRFQQIKESEIIDKIGGDTFGPSLSSIQLDSTFRVGADISADTIEKNRFLVLARMSYEVVPAMWQTTFLTKASKT